MDDYYVYTYTVPGEDKPFYVGKGRGRRALAHLLPCARSKYDTFFYRKLRKLLKGGVKPVIAYISTGLTEEQAIEAEIAAIARWGRRDLGTGCLCNHTAGGEGVRVRSPVTRRKISAANRRRHPPSKETRAKISKALRGMSRNVIHRLPCSDSKKVSLRRVHRERHGTPIESFCMKTGQTVKKYDSIASAADDGFHRANICRVLNGTASMHGRLGWRKVSDVLADSSPVESAYKRRYRTVDGRNVVGKPVESFDPKTGEVVKRYPAITSVLVDGFTPPAVSGVLAGRCRTHKQLGWRYPCNTSADTSTTRPP